MNKTLKIITIVFLVLGALAVVGGVAIGVMSRNLMGRGIAALNLPNNPHYQGGNQPMLDGRNLPGMFRGGRGFGFLGLPLILIGGGLTFLVAGAALLIFKRRILAASEPAEAAREKSGVKSAAVKEKAPSARKNIKKKAA
jgi:hypothetical protein